MTTERSTLTERLGDRGWTPKVRDVPGLLDLLGGDDEEVAKDAGKAVLRVDPQHAPRLAEVVAKAAREAVRPARGRLTRLAGDLVRELGRGKPEVAAPIEAFLLEAVRDADPKTRRAAARALGKLAPSPAIEKALLAAFDAFEADEDKKPVIEALGKVGGAAARAKLATVDDPSVVRARLVLERDATRGAPQEVAGDADLGRARAVRWHVRRGLEGVLCEEVAARRGDKPREVASGVVEGSASGTLADALSVRTALDVAFPLAPERITGDGGVAEAVARALARREVVDLLRAFTKGEGPVRFRVAFRRGGHQRATAWRIAELVSGSALVNDPTSSTWEVLVDEDAKAGHVSLELVPRGHEDTRFAYRKRTVPASSHPTIAAALVRVSPRRDDDVMWDPFAGAGAELVERAFIGPYTRLVGTDLDEDAVAAARANLDSAGVRGASVTRGDALGTSPAGITSIVTNPPMGRRVQRGGHVTVLERFVHHASKVLPPGGSLTWIVPEPRALEGATRHAGFTVERGLTVDMGGFAGELLVLRRGRGERSR